MSTLLSVSHCWATLWLSRSSSSDCGEQIFLSPFANWLRVSFALYTISFCTKHMTFLFFLIKHGLTCALCPSLSDLFAPCIPKAPPHQCQTSVRSSAVWATKLDEVSTSSFLSLLLLCKYFISTERLCFRGRETPKTKEAKEILGDSGSSQNVQDSGNSES